MTGGELVSTKISNGNASRHIKPRWFVADKLSTEAFDLRDGDPPETYVSHTMADGECLDDQFRSAYIGISRRRNCRNGSIAILKVTEALRRVS